jgi:hypothetical protein
MKYEKLFENAVMKVEDSAIDNLERVAKNALSDKAFDALSCDDKAGALAYIAWNKDEVERDPYWFKEFVEKRDFYAYDGVNNIVDLAAEWLDYSEEMNLEENERYFNPENKTFDYEEYAFDWMNYINAVYVEYDGFKGIVWRRI